MQAEITVAIGSKNPVKIQAAQAILSRAFPSASFISLSVPSGVPEQPWGESETRRGAFNRAKAALEQSEATLGLGLEGGLMDSEVGLMTCAWCAIVDNSGKVGYGGGLHLQLPPAVIQNLQQFGELGPAMDALIGKHNTKQGPGAIGILSNGLSSRQTAYEQLVAMACAPFVTDFY